MSRPQLSVPRSYDVPDGTSVYRFDVPISGSALGRSGFVLPAIHRRLERTAIHRRLNGPRVDAAAEDLAERWIVGGGCEGRRVMSNREIVPRDGRQAAVHLIEGAPYFLTWGRIQHAVSPQSLSDLVLRASRSFFLGGTPVSARVCNTLREAAESPDAPYFYECYLDFCHKPVPFGHAYIPWRAATDKATQTGREIA